MKNGFYLILAFLLFSINLTYTQVDTIANNIYENNNDLGIGTTTPEAALHIERSVQDGDSRALLRLRNTNSGNRSFVNMTLESFDKSSATGFGHTSSTYSGISDFKDMGNIVNNSNGISLYCFSNYGSLRFYTNQDANGIIERMRITANGNIGIGTKVPLFPLHLAKLESDESDNILFLQHGEKGSKLAQTKVGGSLELEASDGSDIVFSSFGDSYLNVEEGNFGIGTRKPQAKLEIMDGDVYISDISKGIIMKSPNGECWRGTLNNKGQLNFLETTCPEDNSFVAEK